MTGLVYRHQRVQRLRRLLGRRSARKEEGRFVIEGLNLLEEALSAGVDLESVYVDGDWSASPPAGAVGEQDEAEVDDARGRQRRLGELLARCYDTGARVFELDRGVLARVAGTVSPQPVMAVVEIPAVSMHEVGERRPDLVVVCVDVRDPGNAGTVVRSAWAAGADAVVCAEGTVDMWNPKAVRSSAGAVLHVPVVPAGPAAEVLGEVGSWGLGRFGAVCTGGDDYALADFTAPCAFVVGNEAAGLPLAEIGGELDGLVSIPMPGGAESLNVGMATAVLCFEAARQRRTKGVER
jgi:TrmH family RNA methyltransferase